MNSLQKQQLYCKELLLIFCLVKILILSRGQTVGEHTLSFSPKWFCLIGVKVRHFMKAGINSFDLWSFCLMISIESFQSLA